MLTADTLRSVESVCDSLVSKVNGQEYWSSVPNRGRDLPPFAITQARDSMRVTTHIHLVWYFTSEHPVCLHDVYLGLPL